MTLTEVMDPLASVHEALDIPYAATSADPLSGTSSGETCPCSTAKTTA